MQATLQQPHRAPDGAPVHYERHRAGLKADEGHGGAVTLIQRCGSAANLNIHLHCLVLDGVYWCGAEGVPTFIEVGAPTDDEMHTLLQTLITRLMKREDPRALGAPGAAAARAPTREPVPHRAG